MVRTGRELSRSAKSSPTSECSYESSAREWDTSFPSGQRSELLQKRAVAVNMLQNLFQGKFPQST